MQVPVDRSAFAERADKQMKDLGLKPSDVHRMTGIPTSNISRWLNGQGVPSSEQIFPFADALEVSPRWLLYGGLGKSSGLVDASAADWVTVEEYNLRELTDEGKGEPRNPTPIRRDWLNQTLGVASDLWLARMLTGYPSTGLTEGTLVFCIDVQPADLLEGQLCLFRINGGLVVGRFTYRAPRAGWNGELEVSSSEIGHDDNHYWPIARILGRFIGGL